MQNTTNMTASCGAHFITIGGNVGAAVGGFGVAGKDAFALTGFGVTGVTFAEVFLPASGDGREPNLLLAAPLLWVEWEVVGEDGGCANGCADGCGVGGIAGIPGVDGVDGVGLAPIGGAAENRFSGVGSDM